MSKRDEFSEMLSSLLGERFSLSESVDLIMQKAKISLIQSYLSRLLSLIPQKKFLKY